MELGNGLQFRLRFASAYKEDGPWGIRPLRAPINPEQSVATFLIVNSARDQLSESLWRARNVITQVFS